MAIFAAHLLLILSQVVFSQVIMRNQSNGKFTRVSMIRPKMMRGKELKADPVSLVLDSLLLDYDNRLRPRFGGSPVIVNITMNVDSIGPISEVDMNFRLDISFRQYWLDERLKFNDSFEPLTVNHKFLERIWQPDTYFPESYEAKKQIVMVPNILLRIDPDGSVLYSSRVTIIAKCPMLLIFFPMDIQKCSLIIEAYGYTSKDLILRWGRGNKSVEYVKENLQLAQFTFIKFEIKQYFLQFSTGNFSDLEVTFMFQRSLIYFIIQTYVPATLIVILSWVNFWVNRQSVPARASLAITTVLTMITLMGATNSSLPRVSSIKALDIYFGICFLYVFGALVEFALICYFNKPRYAPSPKSKKTNSSKKDKSKPQKPNHNGLLSMKNPFSLVKQDDESSVFKRHVRSSTEIDIQIPPNPLSSEIESADNCQVEKSVDPDPIKRKRHRRRLRRRRRVVDVSKIDLYSRIMFPLTYIIICISYWLVYSGVAQ